MSKTISTELKNHISNPVTSLATLWRVTRTDGFELFLTDHDKDITFEGNVYESSIGYNSTAIANKADLSVDNQEVTGFMTSDFITDKDLRAGLYDFATITIVLVNFKDISQGSLKMRKGTIGEVTYSEKTRSFTTELRSLTQLYSQKPVELFQAECRADLGDDKCKVNLRPDIIQRETPYLVGDQVRVEVSPGNFGDRIFVCTIAGTTDIAQPVYNLGIGATTIDGTATFQSTEGWVRIAEVTSVVDNKNFIISFTNGADSREVDDWFKYGAVIWTTGNNSGLTMEVSKSILSTKEISLFLEMPFNVVVGDTLEIYAGCDKLLSTCINKFNNVVNFRGEPYVPGQDELLDYPDAR